jgi:hypothetical protein
LLQECVRRFQTKETHELACDIFLVLFKEKWPLGEFLGDDFADTVTAALALEGCNRGKLYQVLGCHSLERNGPLDVILLIQLSQTGIDDQLWDFLYCSLVSMGTGALTEDSLDAVLEMICEYDMQDSTVAFVMLLVQLIFIENLKTGRSVRASIPSFLICFLTPSLFRRHQQSLLRVRQKY